MKSEAINVLFIVNSLQFGGAEKHVVTLLNHLDSARFRLSLAYLKNDATLMSQLDRERIGGRVFCCDVARKIDMRAVGQLAAYIREHEIDIVVCANLYSLLYGWLARIRSRRPVRLVEVFHTTDMGTVKDKFQMLFYRPLILACDKLVYVCQSQRTFWRIRALIARHDTVIHNGIDVEKFSDRTTPVEKLQFRQSHGFTGEDYVIGLCAVMRPEKAHDDVLQAIASLKKGGLDVKCLFIGDGPERLKIEQRIEALGLAQQVRITGFLKDVRLAIAACDAMALVSHYVETFSIAALEAMALGKPMIMSNVGGAGEQIVDGENGYLYRRGDIVALAEAIRRLQDPVQRARMSTLARSMVVRQFSVANMLQAYERLFVGMVKAVPTAVEVRNAG
jgi:glycosyltransferase involved in cell wall biosynthesis